VDSAGTPARGNRNPGVGDLGDEEQSGAGLSAARSQERRKAEEALAGKTTAEAKEQPWRPDDSKQNDHRNTDRWNDGKNESGKRIELQAAEKLKAGRRGSCSCTEMGNRAEGWPDSTMVKPKTKKEQRQQETETTALRSKSNRTKKRGTKHMSNKNRIFIEKPQEYNQFIEVMVFPHLFNY
jgi:hypothetical protein